MTWRIALTNNRYATLISAYAPTLDADPECKELFNASLHTAMNKTAPTDKLILLCDFNARVGPDGVLWKDVLGQHGVGKLNAKGLRLLTFCSEYRLVIIQLKNKFKTSWQHPRSKHWHLLDYIIVCQADRKEERVTRAMRGADCWTDHRLIRAKLILELRPPLRKTPPCRWLNCDALKSTHSVNLLREQIALQLSKIPETPTDVNISATWSTLRTAIHQAVVESIGYTRRRHQDWFDNSAPDIHNLLQVKHKALAAHLSNLQSSSLKASYNDIRAETQRTLRAMENEWWVKKASEIQHHADTNNSYALYDAIKSIYGPQRKNIAPVRSADGTILYKDKQQILDRWAEHFNTLLKTSYPIRMDTLADLPCLPPVIDLDTPPPLRRGTESHRLPEKQQEPRP
ncbi:uncharacterized protein [Syngnathus scovelli]|uniref:uncharacterized protein n=1 Tax=Syngnathus scovelli TaxID=161590 RepID=UPI0021107B49|nr:uncharacterized protein LOC125980616 [Syngnathus scovelli]